MQQNRSNGQMTAQIDLGQIQKNGFDLSHFVYGTGRLGRLIPVHWSEVNAGQTMDIDTNIGVQFEPLAVPTMNNMHVKQEQFYIPKNVVWKNWDKFLSAGENLDYDGKVPSKTLRQIYNFVRRLFVVDSESDGLEFPVVASNPLGRRVVEFGDSMLTFLRERLETSYYSTPINSYVSTYGLEDLYDYLHDVTNYLFEYCDSLLKASDNGYVILAKEYHVSDKGFNESINYVVSNKYLSRFGIEVFMPNEEFIFCPTDEFIAFCKLAYEYIKPLIGYGSYLDMFEYDFITFDGFLFLMYKSLTHSGDNSRGQFGLTDITAEYVAYEPREILTLRSMYSIWYNNYRDQLIETRAFEPSVEDEITDDELLILLTPRLRCWQKDTYTTALASAGTANAVVPVSGSTVQYQKFFTDDMINSDEVKRNMLDVYEISFANTRETLKIPTGYISGLTVADPDPQVTHYFSLSMLDAAKRAQKFLQKALYFGNRIQDFMYTHFGVKHLDARLRLPEWIGSKSDMVKLNVVTNNTTIESEGTIAGDRSAVAYGEQYGDHIHRYCEEHGCIIGLMSIIPDNAYAGGVSRNHSRLDQFDFPFPEFATLGMDAVYDTEIMQRSVAVTNDDLFSSVFGYQGRYYDHKCRLSREHGELLDSMDMYTFARRFYPYQKDLVPKLNERFVHCHPKLDMFVVDNELSDYFRFDVYNKIGASLQLPLYSIYL